MCIFFDYVAPAHPRVISAEADLAFLRSIGNDALLSASEIVVKQILKPPPGKKKEIPSVLPPLYNIVNRPIRTNFAIILVRSAERLVKFLEQIRHLKMCRRPKRIIVFHQSQSHSKDSPKFGTSRIIDFSDIPSQLIAFKESRDRHCLFGLLIHHDC